jgi:adenylate cyclase
MAAPPSRTGTFLFTDLEGSTRLLQALGDGRAADVFAEHRRLLRAALASHGGEELETQGDGVLVAFPSAHEAVRAAVEGQHAITAHTWPDGIVMRVRMGLHTGEPTSGGGALYGLGLHRAARICGAGWGGQVLLSHTTADLVGNALPEGVSLRDLGEHRLKDLERPERIFQVLHPQLKDDFPPLRSLDVASTPAIAARPRQRRRAIDSLAVLPFANESRDQEAEYLSDGLTESLISRLSQLPGIRVMARSTMFRYKGQDTDPQTVGQALNVGAVLMGRVQQRGDALIIGMELVDVANGWQLWGEQYHRRLSDIVSVQAEISTEVSDKLRVKLTPTERKRLTAATTGSPEAYQAYIKGRYFWNKFTEHSMEQSVDFFKRAIDIDPTYALAYAGLADAYHELSGLHSPREIMPRAKAAAMKALELDPSLAEAHAALGWIIWRFDWDWSRTEQEFKRAIELNANYALVHGMYGMFLDSMGRFEESLAAHQRAKSLDPLSPIIDAGLGLRLYIARQYDSAIEHYRKTLETDPNFAPAQMRLGSAYVQKRMFEEAVAAFQKAVGVAAAPWQMVSLGYVYALSGKTDEARRLLAELRDLARQRYVSPCHVAGVHVGLGEHDQALQWLERAYEERDGILVYLKVEPRFDPLRDDPRFQDLMRRVGFGP